MCALSRLPYFNYITDVTMCGMHITKGTARNFYTLHGLLGFWYRHMLGLFLGWKKMPKKESKYRQRGAAWLKAERQKMKQWKLSEAVKKKSSIRMKSLRTPSGWSRCPSRMWNQP